MRNNGADVVYGLGLIGAGFYYLQGVSTFTGVILGIGKALAWPAILVYKLLVFL